jgi:hypothetical protein
MWKRVALAVTMGLAGVMVVTLRARTERGALSQQPPATATATLTGCLRQGSTATVFILRGASATGQSEPPGDRLIVSPASGVALAEHLNQRVSVSGSVWRSGGPAAPAGANTVERALPRLEARTLQVVADKCQ